MAVKWLTTEVRLLWQSARQMPRCRKKKISDEKIEEIVTYIEGRNRKRMLVEDIQDIIEHV